MQAAPLLPARRLAWIAGASLVLAALSLLAPHAPTYDPFAWLIWGREIADGELDTTVGPSWKPLPVLFTTLFAVVDPSAAPTLWLLVARAAGLASIALAFLLGRRLGGAVGGVVAALSLALVNGYVTGFARGNSESLLVALWLAALAWHAGGRHRPAFALAAVSTLLRPEVWAFVALYGLWLLRHDWRGRVPWRTVALLAGSGIAVALLWFVPEYLGSGRFLRGASRALETVPGSPATAAVPFLAVFPNSVQALPLPVYAGALAAVATAWGARRRVVRARLTLELAALAAAYMLVVAAFAQIGFTGNLRYVTLPAALVCVLAGAGWGTLAQLARERLGPRGVAVAAVAALAATAPFVVLAVTSRVRQVERSQRGAAEARDLRDAIRAAGGRAAVVGCLPVLTGPFETQLVAWTLRVSQPTIGIRLRPPGTVLLLDSYEPEEPLDPRFGLVADTEDWAAYSTCGR